MFILLPILSLAVSSVSRAPDMQKLKTEMDAVCAGFHGRMGYYVKNLKTGESIGLRQDEQFPSASTIKTAIMIEAINQIEEGKLKWTDKLPIPPKSQREVSLWTGYLEEGSKVDIEGLVNLMMNVSDNTAAILLSDKVGVENIEKRMLGWGLQNTACTIHVPDSNTRLKALHEKWQNMGVASPGDMGNILERLYRMTAAKSRGASERMLRIMNHEYWDDRFNSEIPPGVFVCSKVGSLNESRSDIAIVYGSTPYIITAYTGEGKDQSWSFKNEAELALRQLGSLAWRNLEPRNPYTPPEDQDDWQSTGAGIGG
ncbi:MAG TPA: serine hydrolase [Fimbriimonadaceae bacterium]|jgi:beta-lactamase class A